MNICIIGQQQKTINHIATYIAQQLHLQYINADEEFNSVLIKSVKYPTGVVENYLQTQEDKLLKLIVKSQNVVIGITDNMYMSNGHYKYFKDCLTIAMLDDKVDETRLQMQKLLKIQTKLNFNVNVDVKLILDKIKGYV